MRQDTSVDGSPGQVPERVRPSLTLTASGTLSIAPCPEKGCPETLSRDRQEEDPQSGP